MIKNYFRVAFRALAKNKTHSFINIFGLATGIACCLLIWMYVRHELSYDTHYPGAERIYRVGIDAQPPGAPLDRFALNSAVAGLTIRDEFPEVEAVTRIQNWGPSIKHNNAYYYDDRKFLVEPDFLDVFGIDLIEGDRSQALQEPRTLLLTERAARKYFPDGGAVGQSLVLQDSILYRVDGVIPTPPTNSHFSYDVLGSWATLRQFQPQEPTNFLALQLYVYMRVREGVDVAELEPRIANIPMDKAGETLQSIGFTAHLVMQPVGTIHLESDRMAEMGPNSSRTTVTIFILVAVFVLFIACINFVNLSTARSMERAREVGLKKVLGSTKGALVRQFLAESTVISLLACMVSAILIIAVLPWFNELSGKDFGWTDLIEARTLAGVLVLVVVTGLLAGSYPAFVLSSFPILEVLRGRFKMGGRGIWLRHGLVSLQFAITLVLISCTLIVADQLDYMRSASVGFDKDQILVIEGTTMPPGTMQRMYNTFRNELIEIPGVEAVAASGSVPGRGTGLSIVSPEGVAEGDSRRMHILNADYDFVETYGIEMVAGRDFSRDFSTDPNSAIVINETTLKGLDWGTPEDALGKTIEFGNTNGVVVGVFRDIHYYSLKNEVEPMLFFLNPNGFARISVRLKPDNLETTLAAIESKLTELVPGYVFNAFFLDEDFDNQYQAEKQLGSIFGTFSVLAVLIACLGLFGMVVYLTMKRTREIGIRKVLGAREDQIVRLLARDFMIPVLMGMLLPVPLVWYFMNQWLQDFPYRVSIGAGVFAAAAGIGLLIALTTVVAQSYRASRQNPAKSLRYE